MSDSDVGDPFAHLKQRASERADRTVDRIRAGVAALRSTGRKITAESLKQVTCDLEPGYAGLSFQVIRRNARAYELYRQAADAFVMAPSGDKASGRRRRALGRRSRRSRASYDPLQGLDKRKLVQRVRGLEAELEVERKRRGALAYDQQALLGKILRLETEIILLGADNQRHD
jgi:hypothetical protein